MINERDSKIKRLLFVGLFVLIGFLALGLIGLFSGTVKPDGFGWYFFAFATGLTMIVLPCTLPLAFVIVPMAMGKGLARGIGTALSFGLGITLTLSIYGILAALVGGFATGQLNADLDTVKNWTYLVAGIFAFVFALGEIGLLKVRMPSYTGSAPAFIQKHEGFLKPFFLGLFLGNIGVGCPHPATPLLLIEIASSGDALYGWTLFLIHAIGRVVPLIILAILAVLGVNGLNWLTSKRERIERATGFAMVYVAGFILTLGLFTHKWWVNSGLHSLLEVLTQESFILGSLNQTLGTSVSHTHGLETGTGLFGLPLWLGNWVLLLLWVIPLWWWWKKEKREISLIEEKEQTSLKQAKIEVNHLRFRFYFALSVLFLITFVFALPTWFSHRGGERDHDGSAGMADHLHAPGTPAEHTHEKSPKLDPRSLAPIGSHLKIIDPKTGQLVSSDEARATATSLAIEESHEHEDGQMHMHMMHQYEDGSLHDHAEEAAGSSEHSTEQHQIMMGDHHMMGAEEESHTHGETETAEHDHGTQVSDPHAAHGSEYQESAEVTVGPVVKWLLPKKELVAGEENILRFKIEDVQTGEPITKLSLQHEKYIHILGLRNDLNNFFHIHPDPVAPGEWGVPFVFDRPGEYKIYADISYQGQLMSFGLPALTVSGEGATFEKEIEFLDNIIIPDSNYQIAFTRNKIAANLPATLSFVVSTLDGNGVHLENYLGAPMHLAIVSQDLKDYLHTHPGEAMPAGEAGDGRNHLHFLPTFSQIAYAHGGVPEEQHAKEPVYFNTTFPRAGIYKMFAQFRPAGIDLPADESLTASFFVEVLPEGSIVPAKKTFRLEASRGELVAISIILMIILSFVVGRYVNPKKVNQINK